MAARTRRGGRSGRHHRIAGGLSLALVTLLGATACGGGSDDDGTGGLVAALGAVRDDATARAWFEYGETSAIVKANGGTDAAGPYGAALTLGFSDLAPTAAALPDALGFDPLKADEGWSAGLPPAAGGVLKGGVDRSKVTERLEALGARRDGDLGGGALWRLRADDEVGFDDPLAQRLPMVLGRLNVVSVGGDRIGYGPNPNAADLSRGDAGRRLDDDAAVLALAKCLDDPMAAILTDRARGGDVPGTAVAAGLRGKRGGPATEVLCAAVPKGSAQAATEHVRRVLESGKTVTQQPWTGLLTDTQVSVVSATGGDTEVVRITGHPAGATRAGVFLKAVTARDLGDLIPAGDPGRQP